MKLKQDRIYILGVTSDINNVVECCNSDMICDKWRNALGRGRTSRPQHHLCLERKNVLQFLLALSVIYCSSLCLYHSHYALSTESSQTDHAAISSGSPYSTLTIRFCCFYPVWVYTYVWWHCFCVCLGVSVYQRTRKRASGTGAALKI